MYYNLGLDKAEIRDLSGAIDMLRRSLKFNKYNIHARNLLGLVYFETGEAVAALSEWIISKNIMPENNVATEYIATLQAEQAKLDMINQTIKKYNSALKCCRENNEDVAGDPAAQDSEPESEADQGISSAGADLYSQG